MSGMMMGGSYPREASALFARMSTAPTPARKKQIAKLITSLKTAGVWDKLDVLYLLAAETSQAALLNWKSTSYNATNNGASFTADRGYTGNGTSAYLATGYSQGNGQSTLNNFSGGVSVRTVPSGSYKTALGASQSTVSNCSVNVLPYAFTATCAKPTNPAISSGLSGVAHLSIVKNGGVMSAYRNGLLVESKPSTLAAVVAYPFYLLALNLNGSGAAFFDGRIAGAYFGSALTSDDALALDTALSAHLTAVGS